MASSSRSSRSDRSDSGRSGRSKGPGGRPQRTGRADNPNRGEREERTERPERADRSDRQSAGGGNRGRLSERKSARPERADEGGYRGRDERPAQDERSAQGERKGKDDRYGRDEYRGKGEKKFESRTGRQRSDAPGKKQPLKEPGSPMRLNKFISNSGVCPRREADLLITAGAVQVNGVIITALGTKVLSTDEVIIEGQSLKPEAKRYVLLNKPKNFVGNADATNGSRTVMQLIANATKENLSPVGRLSRHTTGLMLFTNDDEMSTRLLSPGGKVRKVFHVTLRQKVDNRHLEAMKEGFKIGEHFVKADAVEYVGNRQDPHEIGIEIHSGRNKIVTRMFEYFGYEVVKMDRVIYACLTKKDLPRGHWRHLAEEELNILRMSL